MVQTNNIRTHWEMGDRDKKIPEVHRQISLHTVGKQERPCFKQGKG